MINSCLTKEESERIGLLSQLNMKRVPVEWLREMAKRLDKCNKEKKVKKDEKWIN